MTTPALSRNVLDTTVIVASAGYLVDMYDLFLFSMVRVKSLTDMGLSGDTLTTAGLFVANAQMAGLIVGAALWGMLADRIGRKTCLFASIFLYSIGSICCAFVGDVETYALARFLTAVGLAGELGAGIAIIAEKLSPEKRGTGVMVFITLGFCGVVLAAILAEFMAWRHMYMAGGVAGLLLLLARVRMTESAMFTASLGKRVARGSFRLIFAQKENLKKYLAAITVITPPIFVAQILWTLSPEIALAMGVEGEVRANIVLAASYGAIIAGDFAACYLSEKYKSRRLPVISFLLAGAFVFTVFMLWQPQNWYVFVGLNALIGFFLALWVVAGIWAAEQFGTNIRATVTTTVPNFARAAGIPMNLAFGALKGYDTILAVTLIGSCVFILGFIAWGVLRETYGRDLDFVDTGTPVSQHQI
jgi:MFS family permease